jgi:polysaccharide export outer membrane protein
MKRRTGIVCILLLFSVAWSLEAQVSSPDQAAIEAKVQAQDAAQKSSEPSLKPNPLDVLRNFEPAADEVYRLGKGDEITVDVAGRPDMQAKVVIGPDGRISLPLVGEVMLAGLTRVEAAHVVETGLGDYYPNLAVQITVTKYTANRVLLLGSVEHPGVLTFDGTPTLLEALTRGGLTTSVLTKTSQIPERCAIYRGQNQVVWVELKALIESGNTLADLRLRRDDVIYVPNMAERFVSVLGEVQHPGAIPLTNNSTLVSILAEAGGLSDRAGQKARIQVVNAEKGTTRVVSFNDLMVPGKSQEVALHPGDIIYVPRSGLSRFTYNLQQISPMISVATAFSYAGIL